MDKKLLFNGGEPNITTDDIMRQSFANTAAIYGMAQGLGAETSNFIISGVEAGAPVAGNVTFSAGYIFLNGEVVQVDTQTVPVLGAGEKYKIEKVVSYESGGDKTFLDGTPRQTWQKNRGVISKVAVATVVELEVTDQNRLKYLLNKTWSISTVATWDMDEAATLSYKFDLPAWLSGLPDVQIASRIANVSAMICANGETIRPTPSFNNAGEVQAWISRVVVDDYVTPSVFQIEVRLNRKNDGDFDNSAYSSAKIFITVDIKPY